MTRALLTGMLILGHAPAQPIPFETRYQFGGLIPFGNRWEGPVALNLVAAAGGTIGKIWLRQTPDGIVIFGRIPGAKPKQRWEYARFPAEMKARDYVGLWLATSPTVAMPELGWGLQGGMSNCGQVVGPRALDAENCQAWEVRQLKYREQLRRLFMRHWQLTPHVSFENYATPAYRDVFSVLSNRDRAAFAKLEPTVGGPPMAEAANLQFSYFEIFVRWSDFPPANVLNLSQIYLALDYCEPNHACATTSPGRKDGQPSTFRRLTLERPKLSSASPCGHPLEQADPFGKKFQAWYFPNNEARAADTFALENFIAAYQRDPEGLSPIPVWKHYFSKPVNETEVVCGPELRYVAGGKTHSVQEIVDPNHLEIRHLANGSHLLKSGPTMGTYRALGNGQCGVCETATVTIYHLSPASGVTVALRAGLNTDMPSNNNDGDIVVAPDWQTVTVYDAQAFTADEGKVTWTSRLYCLSGVKYEACGDGPATPPPIPRQIQWKTETQTSYHEGLHGDSTRHSSIAG